MSLTPCPHCHRHVRRTEMLCPFCARAITIDRAPILRSPAQRLGRAAMAAFGAAAVSTSVAACGARGGLEIVAPLPIDAGIDVDADLGCCSADYGGPPFPITDGGTDTGSFIGAYGAPAVDASLLEPDAGASHAEYGGPPFEVDAGGDGPVYGGPPEP